ncbi:MAG: lytic transglycosylase domain-containing protein [Stellaceae bacterium]
MSVAVINILIRKHAKNSEIVVFGDPRQPAVRIVRGKPLAGKPLAAGSAGNPGTVPLAGIGGVQNLAVRVVHGGTAAAPVARIDLVTFADRRYQPVTVLRGAPVFPIDIGLFAPASGLDLDRVAFAVDGAESSHGTDPGMWRPLFDGPQGPMQVSAAAAIDSGGGDRFDLVQNRQLGRAYLALLYRRYGNWPDAVAAYNWGPGNFDSWVNSGRATDKLPLEVERYRDRVLHDVALQQPPTLVAGRPQ